MAGKKPIRDRVEGLQRVRAGDLVPHHKNWRTHPEAQRAALRGILGEIGNADALIARRLPGGKLQLIDGHLRAETTPDQKVPVLVVDLDDAEAEKLLATLDPLAALAGTDGAMLAALAKSVESDDEGLQSLLKDLGKQASKALVAAGGEILQDDVPAPPDAATTQPGDLIVLGNHRLLCGDSSKPGDVDRLLGGESIHLVNTDPPYNVKVEPRSNNAIAAGLSSFEVSHHQKLDVVRHPSKSKPTGKKLRAKDRPLANDFVTDAAFDKLLDAWFGNMARVLLPGHAFYIWGGYANCANYPPVLKDHRLYFSQAIIWVKEHPVLTRKDFMGNHEWCFYGWLEGGAHRFFGPANVPDVWSVKKVNHQAMVHLTEKPVELAALAMRYSSQEGENVLDLFGGSGSTLMGAEQTGRRAYLMELDPLYCDVIVERWEKFTGRKAQRPARNGRATGAQRARNKKTPAKAGV